MKTPTETLAIRMLRKHLNAAASTLEILEEVEGAERRLVPQERSDEGQGDVEQRSAEDSAVPPGEAEAALRYAIDALEDEAAEHEELVREMSDNGFNRRERREWANKAARLRRAAEGLTALLPEPDSDADSTCHDRMPGNDRSSASPDNPSAKRSGRRNDQGHPATTSNQKNDDEK